MITPLDPVIARDLLARWDVQQERYIARREERHLLRTHGSAYEHYRACVGRFVPVSRRPYFAGPPITKPPAIKPPGGGE